MIIRGCENHTPSQHPARSVARNPAPTECSSSSPQPPPPPQAPSHTHPLNPLPPPCAITHLHRLLHIHSIQHLVREAQLCLVPAASSQAPCQQPARHAPLQGCSLACPRACQACVAGGRVTRLYGVLRRPVVMQVWRRLGYSWHATHQWGIIGHAARPPAHHSRVKASQSCSSMSLPCTWM